MNDKKAFDDYLVGAGEGGGDSCTKAGLCLEFGTGMEKNAEKAVSYFKKGYEVEGLSAQALYGICLIRA